MLLAPGHPSVKGVVRDTMHTIPVTCLRYAECSRVPVPPIMSLTDMVARCRLLAAHGARSCSSAEHDARTTRPVTWRVVRSVRLVGCIRVERER